MTLLRRVLGETLRGRRLRQRRTLREVSGAARVSLGYLSEVERGQKEASSELLAAICEALEVRLSDLLREVSDTMRRSERSADVARVPSRPLAPAGAIAARAGAEAVAAVRAEPVRPSAGRPNVPVAAGLVGFDAGFEEDFDGDRAADLDRPADLDGAADFDGIGLADGPADIDGLELADLDTADGLIGGDAGGVVGQVETLLALTDLSEVVGVAGGTGPHGARCRLAGAVAA